MTGTDVLESRHGGVLEDAVAKIAEALSVLHTTVAAQAPTDPATPAQALIDALLAPTLSLDEISDRALDARWQVPEQVAAVAFDRFPRRTVLPPGYLVGQHDGGTVAIVPDPAGPARRATLTTVLAGHWAAVGLPVPLVETSDSLRWARQTLNLPSLHTGGPAVVFAEDHLALLILSQEPRLMAHAVARAVKPLAAIRPVYQPSMVTTLVACFEHDFNATAVADRLHLHPQTIRYRIRTLKALFGARLTDPAQRLELHMLLMHWLSTQSTAG